MSSEYTTLAAPGEAKLREKMSTFLAYAWPCATAAEAKELIAATANRYHDARHVCWAYLLQDGSYLSSDNGEPSGTAGKPILGQIRSAGLANVAVAVARYFGGIKLGTSGLIAAYRESARLALEQAPKLTAYETEEISYRFPYLSMNAVMRLVKDTPEAEITGQLFNNSCLMTLRIRADRADALRSKLTAIDGLTLA